MWSFSSAKSDSLIRGICSSVSSNSSAQAHIFSIQLLSIGHLLNCREFLDALRIDSVSDNKLRRPFIDIAPSLYSLFITP